MRVDTVSSRGRTHIVQVPSVNADAIPVPVTPFEGGYIPQHSFRVEDAYMYRVGPRRWRMRFTGSGNVDSWTDHPSLRAARQHFTGLASLDLAQACA